MSEANFKFDEKGNVTPYEIIELHENEFYKVFVERYVEDSIRHKLYQNFQTYLTTLRQFVNHEFSIWVDGSFVSKKENPNDIDLVSIIDYRDYDLNKSIFDKNFVPSKVRQSFGVDAYILQRFPKDHEKYIFTESDLLYWRNLFGKTRLNRAKKQFPKGIIQLNFE